VRKTPIIVYHADCIDGAASAWLAAKAHGGNVTYVPYDHSNKRGSEENLKAALADQDEVCFVDVTPEQPFLKELLAAGKKIQILDHHVSAAKQLEGFAHENLKIFFDVKSPSASKMIWQHYFPHETAPPIIDLINLMDGSGSELRTPEQFAAAAFVDSRDINTTKKALDTVRGLAKLKFNVMAQKGAPLVADQQARIDRLINNAAIVQVQLLPETKPVDVPIVNGDIRNFGRQISERLVELGRHSGVNIAFAWAYQKTGTVTMSIRSNGDPDISLVTDHLRKTLGITGGGHKDSGAVHFSSLSEFMRLMPIRPMTKTPDVNPAPPSLF
jgi:nanoRNase/pAp phosphatase (c-di-AMP/oligoRNAs hydrolase)